MTANDLITAFETLADSPDGVKRLRELVLQLAARGKLVAQDPAEGSAREYLRRIEQQKIAAGGKKSRRHAGTIQDAAPWELPRGWLWAEFGDTHFNRDAEREPVSSELRESRKGPYDYYGASGAIDKIDDYLFDKPLLLIGEDGANLVLRSTPIAFIARGKYWVNNHAHVLDGLDELSLRYLAIFVNSIDLRPFLTGMAQPKLNQARMNIIPCAVPPLAEQHRIVARVDELMGLLDRLDAARTARDDVGRAARDAALAALRDAEDTDAVEAAWGRIAGQMDALFAEPEDVGPLRQAVLGLAVKGRLVPTAAGDSQSAHVRVGEVVEMLNGYAFSSEWYLPAGVRLVRNQNVGHGTLDWTDVKRVSQDCAKEFARFRLETGDIVLSLDRPLISTGLKVAVVRATDLPCLLLQRVCCPRPKDASLDKVFFLMWLRSPEFVGGIDPGRSNGVPHISTREVERMSLRLPGLAEQHRIVAKVDALMATCDALEARLTTARDLHGQFAAAAVHHLDV